MDSNKSSKCFNYSYSAKERDELLKIRQKYMPLEENKMDQLRRMDAAVHQKPTIISIVLGVFGTLVLGLGMCCCLVWAEALFFPGIVIGITGIAVLALAYPTYYRVLKKEREKIAPEIIRLTEELLK